MFNIIGMARAPRELGGIGTSQALIQPQILLMI